MASTAGSTSEFDSSLFLQFLFSVIFLFFCCFTLMLYVDKGLAILVTFLLRFLVLPRNIRFSVAGLLVAPLQARLLFRGFTLQTENMSVHIVDGYVTLAFWGFWFKHPRWSRVHDYMVCSTLIGTRCRVRRNLVYVKGTVVAVDVERRKVSVQFDERTTNSSDDDGEMEEGATCSESSPATTRHCPPGEGGGGNAPEQMTSPVPPGSDGASAADPIASTTTQPNPRENSPTPPSTGTTRNPAIPNMQRRTTLREFTSPVLVPTTEGGNASNPPVRSEGLGDEVVKVVDANDVFVRSRAGLLQLHLNGLRVCLYNATGKYLDLAKAASTHANPYPPGNAPASAKDGHNARDKKSATKGDRRGAKGKDASAGEDHRDGDGAKGAVAHLLHSMARSSQRWLNGELDVREGPMVQESLELFAARKQQEHNLLNTSFMRRFFNFIGCVELEICSAQIDVGAAGGTHPYFLHLTFQQGEGRVFLTKDSCPTLDLYRFVSEVTLREMDIRMAQMDSKLNKTQVMRNATLYDRARLLFSGVAEPYEHIPFESGASSDLIEQFGIFMDGKEKGTVHLVCYKDVPNIYAGEPIRRGTLPTTGVEVLIDTPLVRYGPWLEYCRTQLWQYFLPPNYLPLQELQFEVGMPRPNAGFELLILFLRETAMEIPFKRRSVVPSPPFGIKDSKHKGLLVATIGAGAQYIQPAFFLLPKEEKQVFEGLFIAKDITVWANCVLERETILCHADSVQFFLDRQDDRLWNGRRLFNILPKLSGVEMYFYMVYVDYFLDLLNDWQFAANMYHDVPLTTELFNTVNRCVRDFVPNVKRFEIFIESMATVYINVNTHNVVYADDPNDTAHNIMAILKLQSGRFSMVLPSDLYPLSYENEVTRPLEASAKEIRAYLSLPASHPLFEHVSAEIPWAYAESMRMNGKLIMEVPNQSVPLPRDNLDPVTGRTKYHNYFNLDIEFMNLRGTLMGSHIKALVQSFQNLFLDNTFTIAPDELFWLLAKLQSHATTGKNRKKEFKQFLEQSQPASNDMEICVTVRLVDVSATAAAGQTAGAPQVNLSTGLVTFSYVKQFAVTDTAVTVSPITLRFPDRHGNFLRSAESNIGVGAVTVGMTKHFGPMPLKPKVHESMEVTADGVSMEVTAEQLTLLVEVAQVLTRHLTAEDVMMEAEVAEALSTAELSAERVVRAGPLRNTRDNPRSAGGLRRRRAGVPPNHAHSQLLPAAMAPSSFLYEDHNEDSDDAAGGVSAWGEDGVEMQEWRVAQRAATAAATEQVLPVGEEDVMVEVNSAPRGGGDGGGPIGFGRDEPIPDDSAVPVLHSIEEAAANSYEEASPHARKRLRHLFGGTPSSSEHATEIDGGELRRPFASTVPYDVAMGFASFMEACNKADDDSKDYGLFFLAVRVGTVSGVVRIGEEGYAAVELPAGLTMAQSTVNDGNSNRRLSVAVKDLAVQLMMSRTCETALNYLPSLRDSEVVGTHLEVMSLHTSLCLRQYVAYPFDGSLENHSAKQQRFVEEHDYENLISFPFDKTTTHCPPDPQLGAAAGRSGASSARAATAVSSPSTPAVLGTTPSAVAATSQSSRSRNQGPHTPPPAADAAGVAPNGSASAFEPATMPRPRVGQQSQPDITVMSSHSIFPTPMAAIDEDLSPDASHAGPGSVLAFPRPFVPEGHDSAYSTDSDGSRNTMAHNRDSSEPGSPKDDSPRRRVYRTLSDTMFPVDTDKMESSNRFETCLSATAPDASFSSLENSTDEFFEDTTTNRSSRRGIANRAFAADRDSDSPLQSHHSASSQESSSDGDWRGHTAVVRAQRAVPSGKTKVRATPAVPIVDSAPRAGPAGGMRSLSPTTAVPAHEFYRLFDKAESDDNGVCTMDYWPPQRASGRQKVRDRTGFHAQLPVVGFYINTERQTRAPTFFVSSRHNLLQKEEDLLGWALCIADNRERSKHKSTSRHLHIAVLDPLTVLVTPEAAMLAGIAARLFRKVYHSVQGRHNRLERAASSSSFANVSSGPAETQPRLLRSRTKKSKVRTQQKRWLWENNIMSVAIPSIEVKLLTRLPVPPENLVDPGRAVDGMYTSTLLVRSLRGIMSENRPPSGEEVGDAPQKLNASLKVDTLAVVTQAEWEPMRREGNLDVTVPDVWYNADKTTLAVVYLTQVAGKGKRDLWRGTDGGACNITTAAVAAHVTRDFTEYAHQVLRLTQRIKEDVQGNLRADEELSSSATSVVFSDGSPTSHSMGSPQFRETGAFAAKVPAIPVLPRLRRGRTIQGKGYVGRVTVCLVDTERVGPRVVVNTATVSQLEMVRPFCNFVVVTPSLLRDRQVHIQGVGEIDVVQAHVLPSVLHVLHPRAMWRGPVGSPLTSSGPSAAHRSPRPDTARAVSPLHAASPPPLPPPPTNPTNEDHRSPVFIYDGTFTVHHLDLRAQHSKSNYMQLVGRQLTGCAESRMEPVPSRECVQTEALTETISERLKARLRYKANRARERAKRSRFPAPPDSIEQLQLHSTASFFAQQVILRYVAECVLDPISHGAEPPPLPASSNPTMQLSYVFSADIGDVALVAHFASQYNVHGDQTNLLLMVRNVVFDSPYCVRAAEILHPQVSALVLCWKKAVRAVTSSMRRVSDGDKMARNGGGGGDTGAGGRRRSITMVDVERGHNHYLHRSQAITLQAQATSITGYVGLPQGIVQKFLLPQISCFTQSSSNGRVDMKLHLHPFTITAHNAPQENYSIVLPHVYLLYGHDAIKMLCNVTMGTVSLTITPLFVKHLLLTYDKLINDILAVTAAPEESPTASPAPTSPAATDHGTSSIRRDGTTWFSSTSSAVDAEESTGTPRSRTGPDTNLLSDRTNSGYATRNPELRRHGPLDVKVEDATTAGGNDSHPASRSRRQNFLFLLHGVRLSYLTSMTTLRFTVRNLNATADTSGRDSRHTLQWVVHVTDAQAALVDQDDHDQLMATYRNLTTASSTHRSTAEAEQPLLEHANGMRTAHQLSGFLWGSVGLSVTLSSGKVDENRAQRALQESSAFSSYSEELQKALLSSFVHSSSKWELSVYQPLVILRIGLDSFIKQCIRETEEDVREMKRTAHEDAVAAREQLHHFKRFQRFQQEKKRIDDLIKRAQRERQRKLRSMTERVLSDVAHRRSSIRVDGMENDSDLRDFLSSVTSHKVIASITNFMVVVPFGDAPYRSVLEELPGTFSCGKSDRHIHSASCLNRRKFVPSCAVKMRMNTVSFICNVEVVKRLVPVLTADSRMVVGQADSFYATGGSADQHYNTSVLFVGRLLAQDSHVFFSDGSPLDGRNSLSEILRHPTVVGGRGLLTSYSADEHHRSLNCFTITSIEAPIRVMKKANTMTVGLVVDVSEPEGRISSLLVGLLREFSLEVPASKLSERMPSGYVSPRAQANAKAGHVSSNPVTPERVEPEEKEPVALVLDIIGRLEASKVSVFCYSNPDKDNGASSPNGTGVGCGGSSGGAGTGGGASSPMGVRNGGYNGTRSVPNRMRTPSHRRVGFESSASVPKGSRWRGSKSATSRSSPPPEVSFSTDNHFLIMTIPLPGVFISTVVRRARPDGSDDETVVRAELRTGTVELTPSITALAQEVELCADLYQQHQEDYSKKIFAFVREMEGEVHKLTVPLHCPLVEVLLPMPRAYAGAVAKAEMLSVVRLRHSSTSVPAVQSSGNGRRDTQPSMSPAALVAPRTHMRRGLTSVHVSISDFRLTFTTEPAATIFTVYLDKGGTIDFVSKHFIRSGGPERFLNKFPDVSLTVTMRRLRAECQTKLEVKSLELFLPEAEVTVSRRSGRIGIVNSVAAYFPFNVEGTEPNITVRLQHIAQFFLVFDMWSLTARKTMQSVRHLAAKGGAGDDIARRVARTQLGRQAVARGSMALRETAAPPEGDRRTMLYLGLSHAVCFCDMGAGSTHQLVLSAANVVVEAARRAPGCSVTLLMGRVSNTSIRSEGVLSGGVIIGDVMAKGFVIQNAENAAVFVRSPEQRTFRESFFVQQVHVNFKERQLKDVFDCKVVDFQGNSMDGVGEEDYTTTDLDAALRHSTLGVTPSTVPAFLSFVRTISGIVADQRRISAARMKEKSLYLEPTVTLAVRGETKVPALAKPVHEHKTSNDSIMSQSSTATQPTRSCIPFMGNRLLRVPCGQLRIAVDDTNVLLGAIASGEATSGCVVLSFSKGRLSFAECPSNDYRAVTKVLVIETHNMELFRPGTPRVSVMGFHGVNHFEFFTRQMLGSAEVGFTLTLRQTNPWTGNPRFRDFEEMIALVKSFTDKKNADVIRHFGRMDTSVFDTDMASAAVRQESRQSLLELESQSDVEMASPVVTAVQHTVAATEHADSRVLKALRSSKFSPQLRFGGDVSVNTEVILNWLGVTEKMLPHVVHVELCDKLERLLNSLTILASERVRRRDSTPDSLAVAATSMNADAWPLHR